MWKGFSAVVVGGILTLGVLGAETGSDRKGEKAEAGKKEKAQVLVVEKKKSDGKGGSGNQSQKSGPGERPRD